MTQHNEFEYDTEAQTPVNTVRVSDSLKRFIIDECVICGETHSHGSKSPAVANGGRSPRVAHCDDFRGQYYLELQSDYEPPQRWYSYAEVDQ